MDTKSELPEEIRLAFCLGAGIPYQGALKVALQSPVHKYELMHAAACELLGRGRREEPLRLLEVGSWTGGSAMIWLDAARVAARLKCPPALLTCIDPWAPYFDPDDTPDSPTYYGGHPEMYKAASDGTGFELFLHNIASAGLSEHVQAVRDLSEKALVTLPKDHFDFIYIDGNHSYDAVRRDLELAMPLLKDGGILCGDDLDLQVEELPDWEKVFALRNHDWVDAGGGHFTHPGVTFAVHEAFGRVKPMATFWGVEKRRGLWHPIDMTTYRGIGTDHLPFYFYPPSRWPTTYLAGLRQFAVTHRLRETMLQS